ncbi:MAG: TrmH family RNA methyltransferase [Acidimicrobiales bacterium]
MADGAVAPTPLSADNHRVKHLRRLARSRRERADSCQFVIEGPRLVVDAARAGVDLQFVVVPHGDPGPPVGDVEVFEIPEHTFTSLATTATPQPALAVAARPAGRVAFGDGPVLALAGVSDPGNAGTLIRAAEAAGAAGVVLVADAVDAFGPKVVRASAGSVFRLPIETLSSPQLAERVAEAGVTVWGSTADGPTTTDEADLAGAPVLVLGNEAHGVAPELSIDHWVAIPMAGDTESLNVAMAGTVLLFEAFRQRRNGRGTEPSIA